MHLLQLAVKAQLPLVAIFTRDCMNFPNVLEEVTGKKPSPWISVAQLPNDPHSLYWHRCKPKVGLPLIDIYQRMMKTQSTMILVNPDAVEEPMFDAGEAPIPKPLLRKFVKAVCSDDAKAEALMRGLGGCTLKETAELARLTMARDASLTVKGLTTTRKDCFAGQQGLTQVDTAQGYYIPPDMLKIWVAKEKSFFLTGDDTRLVPRGLLADGPPGTGKTSGAKWIAEQFGIPLFRLDVVATKSKWVGSSEGNFRMNLARVDENAECVLLIDEVEKVFNASQNDTSGTTSAMLSQMLWWLAEHRSRVLTFMTTNRASDLPKELYREGRIDKVLIFHGLYPDQAKEFVHALLKTFPTKAPKDLDKAVEKIVNDCLPIASGDGRMSHAALTEGTYGYLKSTQVPLLSVVK